MKSQLVKWKKLVKRSFESVQIEILSIYIIIVVLLYFKGMAYTGVL